MAALAADLNVSAVGVNICVPMSANAADTFYKGAVVFIDASGGVQVTWSAGDRPIGISPKQQITTAAGDLVEVCVFGVFWVPAITGIAAADEGNTLIFDTNAPPTDNIDDADSSEGITEAAGDMRVGRVLRYTASRTLVMIGGITGSASVGTAGTWD